MRVESSLRLELTGEYVRILASVRLRLDGPGFGLSSIDYSFSSAVQVAYGSAASMCDLVPGLSSYSIGQISGGCFSVLGYSLCFGKSPGIRLQDILPCEWLAL